MTEVNVTLDLEELADLSPKVQINLMKNWFYERFEDPAHRTPYVSAEGGYIWIWGGPYDAREELESQFLGHVSDELINQLAEELESECWQWAPVEQPGDYDDYFIQDIVEIENCHKEFKTAISDIVSLLEMEVPENVAGKMHSLLFVNVITALEAYLSDKFIKRVMNDEKALRRCVESSPEFKNEKVPLSEVLKIVDSIKIKTKKYLADVVWHNLGRIKPMYKSVLQVDIGDIKLIMNVVAKRHDLVHRNGRDKNDNPVNLSIDKVQSVISCAEEMVELIESQLSTSVSRIDIPEPPDVDF